VSRGLAKNAAAEMLLIEATGLQGKSISSAIAAVSLSFPRGQSLRNARAFKGRPSDIALTIRLLIRGKSTVVWPDQ
jgi:hypothetical protein